MTILKVVPLSLLAAVALVGGCSQGKASIGDEQDAQVKSGLDAFVGNWDGYLAAYTFADNSDRVRISISKEGAGTVRFGDQEIFAQPTNQTDTYPPTFPALGGLPYGPALPSTWPGFLFDLVEIRAEATRLKATATSTQPFDTWCRLQTPYFIDTGIYACTPCDYSLDLGVAVAISCKSYASCSGGRIPDPDFATVPITCEQEALCAHGYFDNNTGFKNNGSICACDASGCKLAATSPDIMLDATLIENQRTFTGSLAFGDTNRTIWLQRQ